MSLRWAHIHAVIKIIERDPWKYKFLEFIVISTSNDAVVAAASNSNLAQFGQLDWVGRYKKKTTVEYIRAWFLYGMVSNLWNKIFACQFIYKVYQLFDFHFF